MKTLTINNYTVTIFETGSGDSVFIDDPKGNQIYDAKVIKGEAIERAKRIIAQQ